MPFEEQRRSSFYFSENEFDLVAESDTLDVTISVDGYRLVELTELRGDHTVNLRGGIEVRIVLRGDAEIPQPPYHIKVALVPESGGAFTGIGGIKTRKLHSPFPINRVPRPGPENPPAEWLVWL